EPIGTHGFIGAPSLISPRYPRAACPCTLKKIRTKLLNCIEVQNPILLLDVERELSLDVPGWAGDLYKRSQYAQEMLTAERKMAAAKKKRPVDEAFHEERRAKLEANIAAA